MNNTETCTWAYDVDGYFITSCGNAWSFEDGGREENNCSFCPCCGGWIEESEQ